MRKISTKPIKFVPIHRPLEAPKVLFDLLAEREPDEFISHVRMPTWVEHMAHLNDHKKYRVWYLISVNGEYVGDAKLSRKHEIGIHIFKLHQHKGYGSWAVKEMMRLWQPGPFYANISPKNDISRKLFEKLGFSHLQNTYRCK